MKDSRVEIGSLSIANSQNYPGRIIYWNKDNYDSWLMIGYVGLTFCHSKDRDQDPVNIRNSHHIYNIIGIDDL